jgi:holo-[acyl-carrier protein] synthase
MHTLSHGIDIVLCRRIEEVWKRHAAAFLDRIYTPAEQKYCVDCKTPVERLAGRWAAKEAVLKALGTGWRGGIEFTDIEVLPDGYGRPVVTLHGRTRQLAESLGIRQMLVSISHGGEYAVATAIGVGA